MRREEIRRIWENQLRRAGGENAYRHDPTFALLVKQGLETLIAADEVLSRLDLPVEDWQRQWFAEQMAEKLMPPVSEAEKRLLDYALALEKEKFRHPALRLFPDRRTPGLEALRERLEPPERVELPNGPVGEILKPGVVYTWPRTETFKRWYDDDEE